MNKQSTPSRQAMRPALLSALVASAVLLMSGCSMVPVYERPAMAVPAQLPQDAASAASDARSTVSLSGCFPNLVIVMPKIQMSSAAMCLPLLFACCVS